MFEVFLKPLVLTIVHMFLHKVSGGLRKPVIKGISSFQKLFFDYTSGCQEN